MNTMTDVAGKVWSWAFCQSIHARQRAEELLREESAQGTTEYAILVGVLVVIAILAITVFRPKLQELWDAIATEYAILVGVLVVIAIIAIVAFKGKVQDLWSAISEGINSL